MLQLSLRFKQKLLPLLIFSFFLLVFLATNGGHFDPYDGPSFFLITENFVLNGSPSISVNSPSADNMGFNVQEYVQIKAQIQAWSIWMNEKPPDLTLDEYTEKRPFREVRDTFLENLDRENYFGPAYLVLPIIASPLYAIALSLNLSPISFVSLFLNSIIIATSAVVIFYLGKVVFKSEKIGFVLSLIFGVTSFIWPYTTSMFARPLAILFLILAIYFLLRYKQKSTLVIPFLVGVCIGLSSITHMQFLMLIPPITIFGIFQYRKNKKHLFFFIVALLVMLSVEGYRNYEIHGSPFDLGYMKIPQGQHLEQGNVNNLFEGVYGSLFSPGYSFFIYFPITLMFPFGLYYLFKQNKSFALLLLSMTLIIFLQQATHEYWNSNPYWGPHRYFTPIIPFIVISLGSLLSKFSSLKFRFSVVLLSSIGFIVNLLGNLVWVQYAYAYGWGPGGLWKIEDKADVFTWDPNFSLVMQTIKVLSENWVASLPINPEPINYFRAGLNGCSYDLYIYCEYGLFPIILLGIGICGLGFVIIKILKSNNTHQDLTKHE